MPEIGRHGVQRWQTGQWKVERPDWTMRVTTPEQVGRGQVARDLDPVLPRRVGQEHEREELLVWPVERTDEHDVLLRAVRVDAYVGFTVRETPGLDRAERHLFLCIGPDCCATSDGERVWEYVKKRVRETGLKAMRTKAASCEDA